MTFVLLIQKCNKLCTLNAWTTFNKKWLLYLWDVAVNKGELTSVFVGNKSQVQIWTQTKTEWETEKAK